MGSLFHAGVAKLVDAVDSKSTSSNRVLVRVRSPATMKKGAIASSFYSGVHFACCCVRNKKNLKVFFFYYFGSHLLRDLLAAGLNGKVLLCVGDFRFSRVSVLGNRQIAKDDNPPALCRSDCRSLPFCGRPQNGFENWTLSI